ncbi:MAG: tetratricopeptide repeat protein [Gemmatimonadota bacterium]
MRESVEVPVEEPPQQGPVETYPNQGQPIMSCSSLVALCLAIAAVAGAAGGTGLRAGRKGSAGGAATAADSCAVSQIEASSPRGKVLDSEKLVLRWRAVVSGPYEVTVRDEDGRDVFTTSTFAHELRVLVGPMAGELAAGAAYSWTVRPASFGDATCPAAEFRLLSPQESAAARARFEAAAREVREGRDDAEPAAGLALARRYVEEGFYIRAEAELQRLIEQGWADPAIDRLLADLYRRTKRAISLREMPPAPEEPGP